LIGLDGTKQVMISEDASELVLQSPSTGSSSSIPEESDESLEESDDISSSYEFLLVFFSKTPKPRFLWKVRRWSVQRWKRTISMYRSAPSSMCSISTLPGSSCARCDRALLESAI
jgi:hypothetical protein